MKYIIKALIIILWQTAYCQATFYTFFGTTGDDVPGQSVEYMNNIYMPFASYNEQTGVYEGFVYTLDVFGNITIQTKVMDSFYSVYPAILFQSTEEELFLACFVQETIDSQYYDIAIVSYNPDMELNWIKLYDFNISKPIKPHLIEQDNGEFVIAGSALHKNSQNFDAFAYKFDITGNLLNPFWFNYPTTVLNFAGGKLPNEEGYIFAKWGAGLGIPRSAALVTTDESFTVQKKDTIIWGLNLEYDIKFISDTTFVLSGKKDPDNTPPRDDNVWLMILDTANRMYHSAITGSVDTIDHPAVRNLAVTNSGNILAGFTKNAYFIMGAYPSWFGLACFDSSLNPLWVKYYGDGANWMLYFIMATSDGGCLLAGSYYDWNAQYNERDIVLVKVDSAGIITSIPENALTTARDAIVYPNPGREKLTIESGRQIAGATFVLYDMAGKTLIEKNLDHTTETLPTAHLPSGLYLWNIIHKGKAVESGKWVKE